MVKRIDRDHRRFKRIIKGEIKKNLKKFISKGMIKGYRGKEKISVPIPHIDIPHFVYGQNKGIGSGEGGEGDGTGQGQAGDQPGEDFFEVELTLEELAEFIGEELELPNIRPKGIKNIVEEKYVYTRISKAGPESLRHFKRTFKEALKRQIMAGEYDEKNPIIIPIRDDKRYRSWKTKVVPEASAVIIYMMDTSGSMGWDSIDIVRRTSFLIDTWLKYQYKGIEMRYIIHDAEAKEVGIEQFFTRSAAGGTKISTAYKLCREIIKKDYPPDETNIYLFQFSDGGNWGDDSNEALELLEKMVLDVNLFGYGQVQDSWGYSDPGSGFLRDIKNWKDWPNNLITTEIQDEEGIYGAIKKFLGKGK